MKKILFIMNNLGGGGAEKVLIDILDVFDYKKYKVDLLVITKEGLYIDELNKNVTLKHIFKPIRVKQEKIKSIIEIIRGKTIRYFAPMIYKSIIREKYDVEIAFLEGFPSTYLLSKSTNRNSKKIAWIHTDLKKSRTLSFKNERKMYSKIDKVVCVSKDSKKVFEDLYRDQSEKAQIIYNIINKEKIREKANEIIDYKFTIPTIVSVGRLSVEKRFDILIKAHKILIDNGIENKLLILGEGCKRQELEELIVKLDVKDSVDLIGFKNNPYPYIEQADVFSLASDFEGFSLVVAEALVLGKPIVATRCVGPIELLNDGEFGVLTECEDYIKLSEALNMILTNKKVKSFYSQKSKKRSLIFDKEVVIKEIYNVIDSK